MPTIANKHNRTPTILTRLKRSLKNKNPLGVVENVASSSRSNFKKGFSPKKYFLENKNNNDFDYWVYWF
jgi:hypothetical protein